jgi:hypothetical protein
VLYILVCFICGLWTPVLGTVFWANRKTSEISAIKTGLENKLTLLCDGNCEGRVNYGSNNQLINIVSRNLSSEWKCQVMNNHINHFGHHLVFFVAVTLK